MLPIKKLIAVSLVCLASSAVSAQITFELVPVPIPAGTQIVDGVFPFEGTTGPVLGTLDNFVCQDLVVETIADWTAAAMVVELTSGAIHQELEGIVEVEGMIKFYNGETSKPPSAGFFPVLPSTEYDTYLHSNGVQVTFQGAAGDVGGDAQQFDATQIDASWSGPIASTNDIGSIALGRFTLTDNATGIWRLIVKQRDDLSRYVVTGTIANGVMLFDP